MIVPALLASAGAASTFTAGYFFAKSRGSAAAAAVSAKAAEEVSLADAKEKRAKRTASQATTAAADAAGELEQFRIRFGLNRKRLAPRAVIRELMGSTMLAGIAIGDEEGLERDGVGEAEVRETLAAMASRAAAFSFGELLLTRMPHGETLGLARLSDSALVGLSRSGGFPSYAFERAVYEMTKDVPRSDIEMAHPARALVEPALEETAAAVGARWIGAYTEEGLAVSAIDAAIPTTEQLAALGALAENAAWCERGNAASVEWRRTDGACLYVPGSVRWLVGFDSYGLDDDAVHSTEAFLRRVALEAVA